MFEPKPGYTNGVMRRRRGTHPVDIDRVVLERGPIAFEKLNYEQLEAVVEAYQEIMEMPGVTMVEVAFVDRRRTEPGIVVYVDASDASAVAQLPTSVAGVPVVAKVEDPRTGQVVDAVDPRKNGGRWPNDRHGGALP